MRRVLFALAVLCCATAPPVLAEDGLRPSLFAPAGDDAFKPSFLAQAAGEARPLREILAVLRGSYPGEVLDARLFEDNGAQYYEIKILGPDSRVVELIVTADTGQVVSQR